MAEVLSMRLVASAIDALQPHGVLPLGDEADSITLTVEKILRAKEILERNQIYWDEGGWVFWNDSMAGFVSLVDQRRKAAARRKKARQRKCGYRRTR